MKFRKNIQSRSQAGLSLVEVLIAVVILSVVGGAVLNSISSGDLRTKSLSNNQREFNYLTAASEILVSLPFVSCNPNNTNPYSEASSKISPVVLDNVEAFDYISNSWLACSNPLWNTLKPSLVQRLNFSYPDSPPITRSVIKNLKSGTSEYSIVISRSSSCADDLATYDLVSQYQYSISLLICKGSINVTNSLGSLEFFTYKGKALQSSGSSCSPSIGSISIAISQNNLLVCSGSEYLLNVQDSKKEILELGAIIKASGEYVNPKTLTLNLFYPPTIISSYPIRTESNQVDLICPSTSSGLPIDITCPSKSFKLEYAGGVPEATVDFGLKSTSNSSITLSSGGNVSLSNGIFNGSALPVNYPFIPDIGGGGLPVGIRHPQIQGNLMVRPQLSLETRNISKTWTCSSTSSSCIFPFTINTNIQTGVGSFFTPDLYFVTSTTGFSPTLRTYSWDSANWRWTINFSVTVTRGNKGSVFCKPGDSAKIVNFNLNDTFPTSRNVDSGTISISC